MTSTTTIYEFDKIFYPKHRIAKPSKIASGLLPLIEDATDIRFPEALIDLVGDLASGRPRDIETVCKGLAILWSDSKILEKPLNGIYSPDMRFGNAFSLALSDKINDGLGDVFADDLIGDLSINHKNIRLTTALLSASAIKNNLQPPGQRVPESFILVGLQDPNPFLMPEPVKNEVFGVVALIHLAVLGSRVGERAEFRLSTPGGVKSALQTMKTKGILKSASSVELLDCVIANVESGYTQNMSENEVWDLLFPGKGY